MLEAVGYLHVILNSAVKVLNKTGNLVAATVVACIGVNILVGDQYLAIVLPGRLFKPAFEKAGLAPRMLSRTLEDSATLTSSLIPWNACGAYMAGTLGIATLTYAPYAILNWVNPIVAIVFAYCGIKVFYQKDEKVEDSI
ncbi:Na(+)/H(+) antiporter NhaC [bioreactor metagenome]|uniref:Na(+)/H(+) antiporter NhaC n=1 Tax=bioreactor metagenome TaxID=1076179 RepID=A0A645FQI5_9ZZZZ